jgi:hypothetical protein
MIGATSALCRAAFVTGELPWTRTRGTDAHTARAAAQSSTITPTTARKLTGQIQHDHRWVVFQLAVQCGAQSCRGQAVDLPGHDQHHNALAWALNLDVHHHAPTRDPHHRLHRPQHRLMVAAGHRQLRPRPTINS